MARTELTPKDIEYKKLISSRLQSLLSRNNTKQVDIHKTTGIPASTLTGYFKGTTLPSPGNVQKLADFFGVVKSDIDPRFETETEPKKEIDLDDDDVIFTYEGRKIPKEDLEMIKRFMRGKE